jgi:hypothetical protein
MRDPERIGRILKKIEEEWSKNPDLRLMQLLYNTCHEDWPSPLPRVFYYEDAQLEKRLDESRTETEVGHGASVWSA